MYEQIHQHEMTQMENIAQRRKLSLDFYKRQYEEKYGLTCTDYVHDGADANDYDETD
jgi:hypothetical protein